MSGPLVDETLLLPSAIRSHGIVYRDRCRSIERVVAQFDGFEKEYFVSDHGQRAAVVVVVEGAVLLTRQYRLLINRLSYEIPGGGVGAGEQPAVAAARECLEETGVECSELEPLIEYEAGLDIWRNPTRVFCAHAAREVLPERAAHRMWVPLQECLGMIFAQRIKDSLSVIGLLAYAASTGTGLGGLGERGSRRIP